LEYADESLKKDPDVLNAAHHGNVFNLLLIKKILESDQKKND